MARTNKRTLYSYVKPVNQKWVKSSYKKLGFDSYSQFVDWLITKARTNPSGWVKKMAAERAGQ